jgi:hypothetical protein
MQLIAASLTLTHRDQRNRPTPRTHVRTHSPAESLTRRVTQPLNYPIELVYASVDTHPQIHTHAPTKMLERQTNFGSAGYIHHRVPYNCVSLRGKRKVRWHPRERMRISTSARSRGGDVSLTTIALPLHVIVFLIYR